MRRVPRERERERVLVVLWEKKMDDERGNKAEVKRRNESKSIDYTYFYR